MARQTTLTKAYFDKVLVRINKRLDMVEKTLPGLLKELKRDAKSVRQTLDLHTIMLDKILKNTAPNNETKFSV